MEDSNVYESFSVLYYFPLPDYREVMEVLYSVKTLDIKFPPDSYVSFPSPKKWLLKTGLCICMGVCCVFMCVCV